MNRPAAGPPDDADDLRGFYFRLLLGKGRTQAAIAAAAILAAAIGLAAGGLGVAAIALLGGALVALIVVFAIADSRSEKAFFDIYGEQRKMAAYGKSRLPEATPLLRKGDDRYAELTVNVGPTVGGSVRPRRLVLGKAAS